MARAGVISLCEEVADLVEEVPRGQGIVTEVLGVIS